MKRISLHFTVLFLLAAIFMGGSSAWAQQADSDKNWQFNLTPFYLWAVTIDGDLTVGNISAPVNLPFNDIVDNLEAAFIVHFQAMHKKRVGIFSRCQLP